MFKRGEYFQITEEASPYLASELYSLCHRGDLVVEILGGPTGLDVYRNTSYLYTVRIVSAPDPSWIQRTIVINDRVLLWSKKDVHRNVVYGHCPQCDEGDSIFYSDDYICAWCREKFVESLEESD